MLSILKKPTPNTLTALVALCALCVAGVLYLSHAETVSVSILKWVLLVGSLPHWYRMTRDIFRGKFGVDFIAGVALAATLAFGENLAGVVVLIMLSGGQTLEEYAIHRARRDLTALLSRAPQKAHVKKGDTLSDIQSDNVLVDMVVTIKPGEIVPVDGIVVSGKTIVDESVLTGESIPVEKTVGALVYSGTVNSNGTIDVRVTKPARESRYSQIVELVKEAEKNRAPLVRLADRYSVYFTVITFVIAGVTWFLTHNSTYVLSVLVVATPCPLILATPIAFISGMNRAAARGIIVKNGGSLEKLAEAKTFIFDKTGTLTLGAPEVDRVVAYAGDKDSVLRISASLDQLSAHTLAVSVVHFAKKSKITLSLPEQFEELFGDGVMGFVDGKRYFLGKLSFVRNKTKNIPNDVETIHHSLQDEGMMLIFLADTENVLGYIVLTDKIRNDSAAVFNGLRHDHIKRIIMLTGDKQHVADSIAMQIGITEVHAESLPDDKLRVIQEIPASDRPVVMVGDGINDAPALAAADVGIGLATQGKTATSDSADVVLISSSLSRVRELLHIARHTLTVAKQGIWIGIGLSVVCMIFAGFGFIKPVIGALMQEGIDVLVILNALRVTRGKILA